MSFGVIGRKVCKLDILNKLLPCNNFVFIVTDGWWGDVVGLF